MRRPSEGSYVLAEGRTMLVTAVSGTVLICKAANGDTEVHDLADVRPYMGIDPPPAFMDADQYADLMANYD